MAGRREHILDAAIRILGQSGMHALSHRAVDHAAELPAGSTSNYFRTRSALLESVVERFADRERATWDDIALQYPTSPGDLSGLLAGFVRTALGANREVTMARYVVLLEAAMQPTLRVAVARTASRVTASGINWMRAAGSSHPSAASATKITSTSLT